MIALGFRVSLGYHQKVSPSITDLTKGEISVEKDEKVIQILGAPENMKSVFDDEGKKIMQKTLLIALTNHGNIVTYSGSAVIDDFLVSVDQDFAIFAGNSYE